MEGHRDLVQVGCTEGRGAWLLEKKDSISYGVPFGVEVAVEGERVTPTSTSNKARIFPRCCTGIILWLT